MPTIHPSAVTADAASTLKCSRLALSVSLANPKSRSFTAPWDVMMTLPGFRSRWMIPESWAATKRVGDLRTVFHYQLRLQRPAKEHRVQR